MLAGGDFGVCQNTTRTPLYPGQFAPTLGAGGPSHTCGGTPCLTASV